MKDRMYTMKHRLREKYGMTIKEYNDMLESQGNVCAICGESEQVLHNGLPRLMAVDHNHSTGAVRGILCNNCNRLIGLAEEDTHLLEKAIAYLSQ